MRTFVAVLGLAAALAAPALAVPASAQGPALRCSRDTFSVGGQAVSVQACAGAPDGGKSVAVNETFKTATATFARTSSIEVLPGAAASRLVEDVSLAPLGLQFTLHLTLAYREARVSVEHALLLPGAVPLK